MTRKLVLILALAACGKGGSSGPDNTAKCEKARDQYLANYDVRMKKLLADDNDKQRANDARDSAVEVTNIKARFVANCKNTPDYKFECFESVEKEDSPECKAFTKAVGHDVVRSVTGS